MIINKRNPTDKDKNYVFCSILSFSIHLSFLQRILAVEYVLFIESSFLLNSFEIKYKSIN